MNHGTINLVESLPLITSLFWITCNVKITRTRDWFKIRSLYNNLFLTVLYMIIYPLLNHPFPTFANNRRYWKICRKREQLVWCRPPKNINKYPSHTFFFNLCAVAMCPRHLAAGQSNQFHLWLAGLTQITRQYLYRDKCYSCFWPITSRLVMK